MCRSVWACVVPLTGGVWLHVCVCMCTTWQVCLGVCMVEWVWKRGLRLVTSLLTWIGTRCLRSLWCWPRVCNQDDVAQPCPM